MAANDVQREIGQQNQGDALNERKPVRNLRVDFGVGVVRMMNAPQIGNAVESNVDNEEQGVVDEEGDQQLQDDAAARRNVCGQSAHQLQRRAPRKPVQRRREERTADVAVGRGEGPVAPAASDVGHGDARVLLNEDQIEAGQRQNGLPDLGQPLRRPLHLRQEPLRAVRALRPHIDAQRRVPGESVGVDRLEDGVEEEDLPSLE